MVAPSLDVSWVSENAELIERATAVDEAASALKSSLEVNFCTSSTGDEGLVADNLGLWKRGIVRRVDGRFNLTVGLSTARKIGNVTSHHGAWDRIGPGFHRTPLPRAGIPEFGKTLRTTSLRVSVRDSFLYSRRRDGIYVARRPPRNWARVDG